MTIRYDRDFHRPIDLAIQSVNSQIPSLPVPRGKRIAHRNATIPGPAMTGRFKSGIYTTKSFRK